MVNYAASDLDRVFAALSDPTRRAVLSRLAAGDASVSELARPFHISLPGVHKHLRVLERAGLVALAKQGRVRRCRLRARPMREAARWIERYRRFWEHQLDALAKYLEATEPKEPPSWPSASSAQSPSGFGARSGRRRNASSARGRRRRR